MINWLSVRHFAITSEVDLELDSGFTAITGETGSGKSLVVGALGVLLGDRGEQGFIQQGMEQAEIQGGFSLPENSPVRDWLKEKDLLSDSELVLRRIIRREKDGRCYINGTSTSVSQLRELGDQLVDIHGQQEHFSLLKKPVQQTLLDNAAGNTASLNDLAIAWDRLKAIEIHLEEVSREQSDIQERVELMQFQLNELDQLNPQENEWESLSQKHKRLAHAADLVQAMDTTRTELYEGDDSVQEQLNQMIKRMRQMEALDPATGEIAGILEEAEVNISEAVARVRGYLDQTDGGADDFQSIEERVSSWHAIARKHKISPDELPAHHTALKASLDRMKNPKAEIEKLTQQKEEAQTACNQLADVISENRHKAAPALSQGITDAMQELGMPGGQFDIRLEPVKPGPMSRTGRESITFVVSANAGQNLQPLSKVASGGEISRISLAIQVILANAANVPTMIFDEVDVGIGGTVANVVGERLRQLGQSCQVLSVTHLPQVASRANQHFSVTKREEGNAVTVAFHALDRPQRIEEISRMAGSDSPTQSALDHARQMLETGDPA